MHFRVRSRSPLIFMTKLYVTTVNSSRSFAPSQMLHRALTEYCNMIHENFKMYQRSPLPPHTTHYKWTKWSQYQFIYMDCGFVINFCCIFSKGTEPFDFVKNNVIQKSAYKVKYISQINRGFMFSASSRLRSFYLSWHYCKQYGKDQYKRKEQNKIVQCLKW